MRKLTMVSLNGRTVFVPIEPDADGKVRVPHSLAAKILNVAVAAIRGCCICFR